MVILVIDQLIETLLHDVLQSDTLCDHSLIPLKLPYISRSESVSQVSVEDFSKIQVLTFRKQSYCLLKVSSIEHHCRLESNVFH